MTMPLNPFLVALSPEQLLKMIASTQDGIRKKTVPATMRGKVKFELMDMQNALKHKIEVLQQNPEAAELWGRDAVGLPVLIGPRDEMGTVTGPKDALSVNVEWGDKGQEDDFYPSELDIRIPSYIWQIP